MAQCGQRSGKEDVKTVWGRRLAVLKRVLVSCGSGIVLKEVVLEFPLVPSCSFLQEAGGWLA
jgi:uncharacterized Zn finger protein